MNTKRFFTALLLILLILPLFAQGAKEETVIEHDSDLVYIDSYYRAVRIPADVKRVISLGPNITEIIFALGKGDMLVGRTDFCDYPQEVFDIPSIGTLKDPNIESIIALEPDLVIGSTHTGKEVLDRIEEAGITTVGIYTDESIEGTYKNVRDAATFLGAPEAAEPVIEQMRQTFETVARGVEGRERPSVYYVVGFGEWGDFTAGGDTFINDLITLAGGENIAKDVSGWSYSLEQIIENDPDIILCSKYWGMTEQFAASPVYSQLRAVVEGNLYAIDNNRIDRQGVRNAEGTLEMARIFHPDAF